MTGTGTQTDPYIVDNWDDLTTAMQIVNANIIFPESGGTIDMLTVAPNGLDYNNRITIAGGVVINGNGWIIKNLRIRNGRIFYSMDDFCNITNLHFINVNCYNDIGYDTSLFYGKFSLSDCIFTGRVDGTDFMMLTDDSYVNKCNITIDGYSCRDSLIAWNESWCCLYDNCIINVNLKNSKNWFVINARNTLITGALDMGLRTGHYNRYMEKCVVDAYVTGGSFSIGGAYGYVNIINSDKVSIEIPTDYITPVTTEQIKDSNCLTEIGFNVDDNPWYLDGQGNLLNKDFLDNKPQLIGAFANAIMLKKVSIPESVKRIGQYAFRNTALTSVTIASDCEYYPTSFPDGCVINFY